MEKNLTIKWSMAREVIHLAYDYDNSDEPSQWAFISQIGEEDLLELSAYLAIHKYTKATITEYDLDWNQLSQIINLEIKYRGLDNDSISI